MAFIAAMTFLPQFRPALLTIATFASISLTNWQIAEIPWPISQQQVAVPFFFRPLIVAAVLASFAAYYMAVKINKDKWYAKQPIRNVLVLYILLLMAATNAPLAALPAVYLWTFLAVLGKYLWFFNYTLLDRHARETPHLALQAGYYTPFWGGSATPFPKGAAYLRKIEARTPEQLAISQLKGIKLLYWALLLESPGKTAETNFLRNRPCHPFFFRHTILPGPPFISCGFTRRGQDIPILGT